MGRILGHEQEPSHKWRLQLIVPNKKCFISFQIPFYIPTCMSRRNFFGGKPLRVYEGVKSSHALRSNSRRTWRPREGARNVYNTAIRRALSPWHPCARVTAGVYGRLRGVAPLRHHIATRDNPVAAHGRRNDPIASYSS